MFLIWEDAFTCLNKTNENFQNIIYCSGSQLKISCGNIQIMTCMKCLKMFAAQLELRMYVSKIHRFNKIGNSNGVQIQIQIQIYFISLSSNKKDNCHPACPGETNHTKYMKYIISDIHRFA